MRHRVVIEDAPMAVWELVRIATGQHTNVDTLLDLYAPELAVIAVKTDADKGEAIFLVESQETDGKRILSAVQDATKRLGIYNFLPAGSLYVANFDVPEIKVATEETLDQLKEATKIGGGVGLLLVVVFLVAKFS